MWPGRDQIPAIKAALRLGERGLTKLARRSGLSKVGIGSWVSLDIDRIGAAGGATLGEALAHLIDRTGRPVVLIVDEAQHAITSAAGTSAMFALKSARDTINIAGAPLEGANVRLGFVFTGSNRDKLATLVVSKNQPFFGSSVTPFPLLGRDYTDAYTAFLNERLAADRQLDPEEVFEAFQIASSRPQILQRAVQEHVTGPLGEAAAADLALRDRAMAAREDYWAEFDALWAGLTPLQRAVMTRLVEKGEGFKPFEAEALSAYGAATGCDVVAADAQSSLEALREKGVVMRLERGRYTLDDVSMIDWFESRVQPARRRTGNLPEEDAGWPRRAVHADLTCGAWDVAQRLRWRAGPRP